MMLRKLILAVVLTAAMTGVGFPSGVAAAAPGTAADAVYYTVAPSYQGAPENLWQIADRFLGDAGRAGEILELNSGRVQPDGGRLADPSRLAAGWQLVLPWDAVGAGLQRGPLPAQGRWLVPLRLGRECPSGGVVGQTLLTPEPCLAHHGRLGCQGRGDRLGRGRCCRRTHRPGHRGSRLAAGSGGGDTGCEGTGTSLAGIVAGDDGENGARFGVAPGARIVPIRAGDARLSAALAATASRSRPTSAHRSCWSASASMLPTRSCARRSATRSRGMWWWCCLRPQLPKPRTACSASAPSPLTGNRPTTIRSRRWTCGRPASRWRASAGPAPSAEYAAAFVAGTVALVRSAHPELALPTSPGRCWPQRWKDLVSPVAAVTTSLPREPV